MIEYDADHFLGLRFNLFHGFVYVFFSVAAEFAGILILVGIAMAAYRRYVRKPETLPTTPADGWALAFLAGIIITGYIAEGLRIAVLGDTWKYLSPVGWGVAQLFAGAGEQSGKTIHASCGGRIRDWRSAGSP